ncbi:glycosyltransferase [Horticoccus luteus]|uniref:Glycosyltransferase n=1 Tax=Horticoccus luteus TaxID=2862869 RepID=A0A8F9TWE4_9BACT|nr:glycosyltransferase [Horticoccus luteus]QYM80474.1 glycosyltransferase [Horticoccus luteus]
MRVCQLVPSLEAQYGGPSKSVYALSDALATLGHDVELLATAPANPDTRNTGTLRIATFQRSRPLALCPSRTLRQYLDNASPAVVHHHSIWLRTLHYAAQKSRRDRIPLVISPRGMLSSWSLRHHSRRKKFARRFVHPAAFEHAAGWHATSKEEAADIRRQGFLQPICIAPNGVDEPGALDRAAATTYWQPVIQPLSPGRIAVFYSRLHPKKRVAELIELWAKLAPRDWVLLVVGIPETYSVAQLSTYASRVGAQDRIKILDGSAVPPPYAVASLFLLPSHSENFGLVIAEAMVHGVPVLVTDSTPWSAINDTGAGRCVAWETYGSELQMLLAESPERLRERGQIARKWVRQHFAWRQSAIMLGDFYRSLI